MAFLIPPASAADFLAHFGWGAGVVRPLAGDASFRRYFRVIDGVRRAVLMDAPFPHEDPRPFVALARYLISAGFKAPEILAADLDNGLVLLEDFGDTRLKEVLVQHPEREAVLYRDAVDLLVRLGAVALPDIPPYDRAAYLREAGLFTQYYCPALGLQVDEAGFEAAWDAVLAPLYHPFAQRVTVLRDYHSENIMVLDGAAGLDALGLIDFQDALLGHPAYDLVSLLQDARRDVPAALERAMLAHYQAATDADPMFEALYHVLGAQRNTKIIGIFTRLFKRDAKPDYLAMLPRVWDYLERDLAHPALAPVAAWFDAHLAPDQRRNAWREIAHS